MTSQESFFAKLRSLSSTNFLSSTSESNGTVIAILLHFGSFIPDEICLFFNIMKSGHAQAAPEAKSIICPKTGKFSKPERTQRYEQVISVLVQESFTPSRV